MSSEPEASPNSDSASAKLEYSTPHQHEKESGNGQLASSSSTRSLLLQDKQFAAALLVLMFGFVLSVVEGSITATALTAIGKHFHDPIKATWVVLSYLLSYMGFSLIFARLSDGIGRRNTLIFSWLLFGGFSAGSGLARTLNELIGLRVLQGIGASGLYTMTFVIGNQITPVKSFGLFGASVGLSFAIGSILGPILGGAITQTSTWRWCYLFNGPCAIVGVFGCFITIPSTEIRSTLFSSAALKRVDYFGGLLLLAASTLMVFALQQAGSSAFAWDSGAIIASLTISAVCWIGFGVWLWLLQQGQGCVIAPIVPLKVLLSRPTGPAILLVLLTGFPMYICIINLPQRSQIVYGESSIEAGIHLLPFLCLMALGSGLGGAISSKRNLTSLSAIVSSCLILLGSGLMSTISAGHSIDHAIYGYETIIGLGCGLMFSSVTMMVNLVSSVQDNAASQGMVTQARALGGTIGLAAATIVFNRNMAGSFGSALTPTALQGLQQSLSTISKLPQQQQAAVVEVYALSFNQQMRIATYISAFGVVAALCTYQRNPVNISEKKQKEKRIQTEQGRFDDQVFSQLQAEGDERGQPHKEAP